MKNGGVPQYFFSNSRNFWPLFWPFWGAKFFFFAKVLKYWSSFLKKYIVFIVALGGGVSRNVTNVTFFFFFFFEGVPKLKSGSLPIVRILMTVILLYFSKLPLAPQVAAPFPGSLWGWPRSGWGQPEFKTQIRTISQNTSYERRGDCFVFNLSHVSIFPWAGSLRPLFWSRSHCWRPSLPLSSPLLTLTLTELLPSWPK